MSVILALTTAAIIIIITMLLPKHAQKEREHVIVKRYLHPGHSWARMTEDGDVLVGIDEFAGSVIGSVDGVVLPRLLKHVDQGSPTWQIMHGTRKLTMVSPVSGRIIEKNEMVTTNPSLVGTSPFGDGWLLRIRPSKFTLQIANLLTGKSAAQWQDSVRTQLNNFFSAATPAMLYQDGGVPIKNLADKCTDEEWSRLGKEFFLVDDSTTLL